MSKWQRSTTGILVAGLALVLVALVASFAVTNFQPKTEIRLGSAVFNVRLATTSAQRDKGLSGVRILNSSDGLLMVFSSDDKWAIWMKDMYVPIDIVWLDSEKSVVHIVTDASPELSTTKTFVPKADARYVLEVPAGTVKRSSISIGTVATFIVEGEQ
jgi:uncharacterized membrane protein (UPF0127 family)